MESLETIKVIWVQVHMIRHKYLNIWKNKVFFNECYNQINSWEKIILISYHSNKLIQTKDTNVCLRRLEENHFNLGMGNSFIIIFQRG